MPEEQLFTLRQISQDLNLPESTIRYYRDSFSRFLPTVGTGRRRRYPEKAVAILRQIAEGYANNTPRGAIEATLSAAQAGSIGAESVESFNINSDSSDESVTRYMEGERDRRDAMWHMAREIVRLSETIDRQGAMIGELAKQLTDQSNRTLTSTASEDRHEVGEKETQETEAPETEAPKTAAPDTAPQDPVTPDAATQPSPQPQPNSAADSAAPRTVSKMAKPDGFPAPVPAPTPAPAPVQVPVPASTPQTPPTPNLNEAPSTDKQGTDEDVGSLREQLARERELVERLRKSKMEIERRAADAESRLGYTAEPPVPRASRPSMFTRFFNKG